MRGLRLFLLCTAVWISAAATAGTQNLRVVTINLWAGLRVEASEVVLDLPADGLYPSDHFGVMADFQVR